MRRAALFFLIISGLFLSISTKAQGQLWKQRRIETSAGIGPSFFFGDVGGFSQKENILGIRDLSFLQTRFNLNGNLKFRILEDLNVRLSLTTAMLKANDERGSNESRSMEAKISLFEPALIGEFYFIKNKAESSYLFGKGQLGNLKNVMDFIDVYAFTGFGGAKYSAEGNDELIAKGLKNKGFTAVIPVGLGSSLVFSPDINFGIEIGGRYAFSDYLDGYTSQYSSSNDVYYFLSFTFTYKMKTKSNGMPVFKKH